MGITERKLVWLVLAALLALIAYICFQAYLNPESLINFGNSWMC